MLKLLFVATASLGIGVASAQSLSVQSAPPKEPSGRPSAFESKLSDADIQQYIALGRPYKNPDKLWNREFRKTNDFFVKGFWWSARLAVFTDRSLIAMATVKAAHELRAFSIDDARSLPDLGKLNVALIISDQGQKQNATRNVHLVLQIGGQTVQPETKNQTHAAAGQYNWFGMAMPTSTVVLELTFPVPDSTQARFVLIGADDKQHYFNVDFSQLR